MIAVEKSDLQKVYDALRKASRHLELRDRMNASLHLASEVRYSPLTSEVMAATDRVTEILNDAQRVLDVAKLLPYVDPAETTTGGTP